MAKNTLTFAAVKSEGEITTSSSAEIGLYTETGEEQTTSVPSQPETEDYITAEDGTEYVYLYDRTTGQITLHPGETIVNTTASNHSGGELKVLIGEYAVTEVKSLGNGGTKSFKNETESNIIIRLGVEYYYTGDVHTYRIDAEKSYYTDTNRTKVYLRKGEILTLTTEDAPAYILGDNGELIATLYYAEPSLTATDDMAFFIAGKTSGRFEFEILQPESRREYEAEYDGGSGILQLRHAMGARVKVYGDAGAGYMLIHEMEGKEIVRAVNMDGFNKMKFVSDGEVDECIVNEF